MRTAQELDAVMKRCQRGTTGYNEANDLHADCYGTIGALRTRIEQLERGEFICQKCGLRKDGDKAEADF